MKQEKYGFVYIWYDRKHKRYYIGSHWGTEDDGYICSSRWMRNAYRRRQQDFKRRIICKIYSDRNDLMLKEQYWINFIKPEERRIRYYNINLDICLNTGKPYHERMLPETAERVKEQARQRWKTNNPSSGGLKPESIKKRTEKQAKTWLVTDPVGNEYIIKSLKAFCEQHNLNATHIRYKGYKGWKAIHYNCELRQSNNAASWLVTDPVGNQTTINNLMKFCIEQNLNHTHITRNGSKGWKAQRLQ